MHVKIYLSFAYITKWNYSKIYGYEQESQSLKEFNLLPINKFHQNLLINL